MGSLSSHFSIHIFLRMAGVSEADLSSLASRSARACTSIFSASALLDCYLYDVTGSFRATNQLRLVYSVGLGELANCGRAVAVLGEEDEMADCGGVVETDAFVFAEALSSHAARAGENVMISEEVTVWVRGVVVGEFFAESLDSLLFGAAIVELLLQGHEGIVQCVAMGELILLLDDVTGL